MAGLAETLRTLAPIAGPTATLAGTFMSYRQNRAMGEAEQGAAEYRAAQLDQQAGQQTAAAQRAAAEDRRRSRYAQSRAIALAAAHGGAGDPTVVDLISDIEGEGTYRAMTDLYQGEAAARQLRAGATASRYQGDVTKRAYDAAAGGSLFRGGTSLFAKYATSRAPSLANPAAGALDPMMAKWALDAPYG